MRLRWIEAKNFLSHEHEEISLPAEGMFLLMGDSGAGKSSLIVDAVSYALYGTVATRAKKQVDLVHKDHPGAEMSVQAMFEFEGGERLVVARGMSPKGQSWAKAYEPGDSESKLLAEGAQPVGRLVRRHLGRMSWQQFYAAFVARQSEINLLTSLRGAERKNLVHRMLGMRELEKASELTSSKLRRLNAEIDQLRGSIGEIDLQAEEGELDKLAEATAEDQRALEEAQAEKQSVRAEIERLEKELSPLRDAKQRLAEAGQARLELRALEESVSLLESRLELHLRAKENLEQAKGLEEQVEQKEAEREQLRELFARSRDAALLAERSAAAAERRGELLAAVKQPVMVGAGEAEQPELPSFETASKRVEVLAAEISLKRVELSEREAELAALLESGECFICQRPLADDSHDVAGKARERIEGLESEVATLESEHGELSGLLPLLEEVAEVERDGRDLERRQSELVELGIEEDLAELEARGKRAADELREVQERLAQAEALKNDLAPAAESELAEARRRREELVASLGDDSDRDLDQKRLDDLEAHHERSRARLVSLEARIPELSKAYQRSSTDVESARDKLAGRRHELEALERLQADALVAEELQGYLRDYQRHLAGEIRPALEEIGSEMLGQISGGRQTAMLIDDDYEIEVVTSSGSVLKASMLSGGEEVRANICLRLALTRLVSQRTGVPVGFLVLDEPLPAQDPGHVERILELLQSLRGFYPQQFVISHVGDLRHADEVDYVLEFEDKKGTGRVKLIAA